MDRALTPAWVLFGTLNADGSQTVWHSENMTAGSIDLRVPTQDTGDVEHYDDLILNPVPTDLAGGVTRASIQFVALACEGRDDRPVLTAWTDPSATEVAARAASVELRRFLDPSSEETVGEQPAA